MALFVATGAHPNATVGLLAAGSAAGGALIGAMIGQESRHWTPYPLDMPAPAAIMLSRPTPTQFFSLGWSISF